MILANRAVAIYFQEHSLAAPFRIHTPSEGAAPTRRQIIEEVERTSDYLALVDNLRSIFSKHLSAATYSPSPDQHFGLGLPAYLHFTSPIRRYADLINHRIAKAIIVGEKPPYSNEEMQQLCQYMNERSRRFLTLRSIKSGKHSFHNYHNSVIPTRPNSEKPVDQEVDHLMKYLSKRRIGNPVFEFSAKPGINIRLTCKVAVRFQKTRYVAEFSAYADKATVKNNAARRLLKIIKPLYQSFKKEKSEKTPAFFQKKIKRLNPENEKPVVRLYQYCREHNLPSPKYHYEIWNGGMMKITCHCSITGELAVSGHGDYRAESKHDAAQKLLNYLLSIEKTPQ
jgi:hypothetical protein